MTRPDTDAIRKQAEQHRLSVPFSPVTIEPKWSIVDTAHIRALLAYVEELEALLSGDLDAACAFRNAKEPK